jgi:hypothetical protein
MSTVDVPSTGVAYDNDDVVVDGTVGGVVLLEANEGRKSALIVNTGDNPMRVTTDGSAPTATHGKPVPVGGSLVMSPPYCPTQQVKAIRQGASNTSANASELY